MTLKRMRLPVFILLSILSNIAYAHDAPDIGELANSILSEQEEQELGRIVLNLMRPKLNLSNNLYANSYINKLGQKLLKNQTKKNSYQYKFYISMNEQVNAFALPGGTVVINSGLINLTDNESELAAVMAHEISHVEQKHTIRNMLNLRRLTLLSLAGNLLAISLATYDPNLAIAGVIATTGGRYQAMLHYSREFEKEADSLGIQRLYNAGFNPFAMPAFFAKMNNQKIYDEFSPPEYVLTHPLSENRIDSATARARALPYQQASYSLDYNIVKNIFKLNNFTNRKDATKHYQKILKSDTVINDAPAKISYATALANEGSLQAAYEVLQPILQEYPENSHIQVIAAEFEYAMGLTDKAEQRLKEALKKDNRNPEIVKELSKQLFSKEKLSKKELLYITKLNSKLSWLYPELFRCEAEAWRRLGNQLKYKLSEANYLIANNKLKTAVNLLNMLSKELSPGSNEELSIQATINELKQRIKDEDKLISAL